MTLSEKIRAKKFNREVETFVFKTLKNISLPDVPVEVYSGGDDFAIFMWQLSRKGLFVSFGREINIVRMNIPDRFVEIIYQRATPAQLQEALDEFVRKG